YCLLLILAIYKWHKMMREKEGIKDAGEHLFLSVLIPARNEGNRIGNLLESLALQDFPAQRYEVILIDDHSEDDTVAIAHTLAAALSLPLRSVLLSEKSQARKYVQGKKA